MAVETTLDNSTPPHYRRPVKVQYSEPEIIDEWSRRNELHERHVEQRHDCTSGLKQNSDGWIVTTSGDCRGYQINEGIVDSDGRKTDISNDVLAGGSDREDSTDNGGDSGAESDNNRGDCDDGDKKSNKKGY
ncbi:unnamed protein product [Litomosoides sigmodontis]|uniref:Uncharacterized protein n=1 Tax=Litomosoides sigmodontis TaxID=42156 RepID=A0A3P6T5C3_LITSI|nr:unnamed protein product [Litomosoides sigmodontis]